MSAASSNTVAAEIAKFDRLAATWWDPDGPMRPLHKLNPSRLAYIREQAISQLRLDRESFRPLDGVAVLDVGCGAGLLSEPMARMGATVTGIDPAASNLDAARAHAVESGLAIEYRAESVEALASGPERFDLVLAMEVVEHVPDVPRFVKAAASCVRPGGLLVMSTLNRTLRSFGAAILAAEYVLRWLPRGTHEWNRFVTPAELSRAARRAGLSVRDITGTIYDPLRDEWRLSSDTAVNYALSAVRAGAKP